MDSQYQNDNELREKAERGLAGQGSVVEAIQRLGKQLEEVQSSVDQLARPHWLLWLTFAVGFVAAVASVIGYWPQILSAVQAFRS